ncbi:hypothetical protein ACIGT4_04875 [Streptomyces sioyaensis]|uniref:hypothetical protein n=1 Tax=Streptomyces sioyaensis TaxID=67364 RepID=UPI0037CD26ED
MRATSLSLSDKQLTSIRGARARINIWHGSVRSAIRWYWHPTREFNLAGGPGTYRGGGMPPHP